MMDALGEKHLNLTSSSSSAAEAQGTSRSDFLLQWGNRKRLRCMKIQLKTDPAATPSATTTNTTTFRLPPPPPPLPHRISRNPESMKGEKVNPNTSGSCSGGERVEVWLPKLVISLTNKEKEEDFMAIKGSKLPQRPKKRPKYLQRTLNLVSPGTWLCDLTLERYQVREENIQQETPRIEGNGDHGYRF